MDWRLDGGPWQAIDLRADVRGEMVISPRPDHRNIGWVKVGTAKLAAGKHILAFRANSKIAHHGGIDCFCLSNDGFVPSGTRKPGVAAPAGPGDWFEAVFTDDAFSPDSVIDVSSRVPAPAGAAGPLRRDGERLRFANASEPVKFWGCGANFDPRLSPAQQTQRVRYLRKYGVNMIRQHPVFDALGPLVDGRLDAGRLDRFDRWFAELKAQGIYSTWSVFYPLRIGPGDGYPAELLAELDKGSTSGVVNFMPQLQALQWRYVQALLEHANPYTQTRYVDEPALAVIEVHNEDCLFWHFPLNVLADAKGRMPRHAAVLRKQFCDWARARYKTDAALQGAWGTRESLADGELRIYGAWQLTGERADRRMGDFIRFVTETQRGFYERRERQLRQLGYQGVTVTTAWRSGGPAADPANLYCDTAAEMIDRHNYFGGGAGGHSIALGQLNNDSHLAVPGGGILASGLYAQVQAAPFAMTEWTQSPPNQYKAEIAPLVAFYGLGLQGWDASYHFLNSRTRLGDGWPNLGSYVTDTPHYIGQFPALATAVYRGDIAEAPLAAGRHVRIDDLFTGRDPLGQDLTAGGHDAKRARGPTATPPEVLAIGKVTVAFDDAPSQRADWTRYWDQDRKLVRSMTGELAWDYGRRIVTVTTPRTQAVIGFAGGTRQELGAITVDVKTPFVSLIFTSMDNEPLARSCNILITAMARDTQSGAKYSADGSELLALGGPPLLMEPVQATITLTGGPPAAVNVLDLCAGVPTGRRVDCAGATFTIDGTHRTCYYQITR